MAKKCSCAGLIEMMVTDPRVVGMPLASRALWLHLVAAMERLGVSVLRYGFVVPKPSEVSMLVGIPETELETHLEPILARGLLRRDDDGALAAPLLEEAARRRDTARINGLKGGRPRKDGTPPAHRQREMMLPIEGGVATEKTQPKPNAPESVSSKLASLGTASSASSAREVKAAVSDEVFHAAGRAAIAAMGLDPARSMMGYGIVRQWLADGADQALIVRVIEARMNPSVRSIGYFTAAIREAVAAGHGNGAVEWTGEDSPRMQAFTAAHKYWVENHIREKNLKMPDWTEFAVDGSRIVPVSDETQRKVA